jgi:glyoxylase-like metal-dependent hydrolase (beta-lactamase superfamily II)
MPRASRAKRARRGEENIMIDRRTLMVAGAAAGASAGAAALGGLSANAKAPLSGEQAPGFYRSKVGNLEVTAINDGVNMRPVEGFIRNADLAAVQKALSDAFLPTNTFPIPFTTLVINDGSRLTLIDTGNGDSGAPTSGKWMGNFRAAGFEPGQVDTILISHFHGDHINGLRLRNGNAVFPNAEIMVPAAEWAFWMDDARMSAAPDAMKPAFQNVRRVFGPIASNVKQYQSNQEVAPGITAVAAQGHTPGHTVFMVQSGSGRLMALSDTTNHPALFVRNPDWSAVFDMNADEARATRRRLLDMAASERAQVAFYHAPFPATGFITKEGTGYRLNPVQWSPVV